jgi:hypothetical protein
MRVRVANKTYLAGTRSQTRTGADRITGIAFGWISSQAAGVAAGGIVDNSARAGRGSASRPAGPVTRQPCALDDAGAVWKAAQAAFVTEDLKAYDPEPQGGAPKGGTGRLAEGSVTGSSIPAIWEELLAAADAFSGALAVARIAPPAMAACHEGPRTRTAS